MEPRPLDLTVGDMRDYVERKTAGGFHTLEEIVQLAMEVFVDDQSPEVLRPIARQLTAEAVAAHLAEQERWAVVTDCDLLDRAFSELEHAGVVARHDFTCCGT